MNTCKKIIFWCITMFLIFAIQQANFASTKLKLAILNITTEEKLYNESDLAHNILEIMLFKHKKFKLLDRKNLDTVLKQRELHNKKCKDDECASEIGKKISADLILTIKLSKQNNYILSYKLIKTSNNIILDANLKKTKDKNQLEKIAANLAKKLSNNYGTIYKEYNNSQNDNKTSKIISNYSFILSIGPAFYHANSDYSLEGYSLSAGFYWDNVFIKDFSIGIQSDSGHFTIFNEDFSEDININMLLLSVRYAIRFPLTERLDFILYPYFSCGYMQFNRESISYYNIPEESRYDFTRGFACKISLYTALGFFNNNQIFLGADYVTNFKYKDNDFRIIKFMLGLQYSF